MNFSVQSAGAGLLTVAAAPGFAYTARLLSFDRYPEGLDFLLPTVFLGALVPVALRFWWQLSRPSNDRVGEGSAAEAPEVQRVCAVVVTLFLFAPATALLGFIPAALLAQLVVLAAGFGARGRELLFVPLLLICLLTLLLVGMLDVPLPRGRYGFAEFSSGFY